MGSNADRTSDFPKTQVAYKTYITESITLAGTGATTVFNVTTQ